MMFMNGFWKNIIGNKMPRIEEGDEGCTRRRMLLVSG